MFLSCNDHNPNPSEKEKLPAIRSAIVEARGSVDEVVAVVPTRDTGSLKRILRQTLAVSFLPLGPVEPILTVHFVPVSQWQMVSSYHRFHTILVFHPHHTGMGQVSPLCREWDPEVEEAPSLPPCLWRMYRNLWARNQRVYLLHYPGIPEDTGAECLQRNLTHLREQILRDELERMYRLVRRALRDADLEVFLQKHFRVRMVVPQGFREAYRDSVRFWLRKDEGEWVLGLVGTILPESLARAIFTSPPEWIAWRNSWIQHVVLGPFAGDHMITDTLLFLSMAPYGDTTRWKVLGLWRLKKAFMGGPFVGVYHPDFQMYLEGFLYAPGKRKRSRMRKLEAIVYFAESSNLSATLLQRR